MYTSSTRGRFLILVRTGQHKELRQFFEGLTDSDLRALETDTAALVGTARVDRATRETNLIKLAATISATDDPQIAALLRERAGYVTLGHTDHAAQVDAELARHGYPIDKHGK